MYTLGFQVTILYTPTVAMDNNHKIIIGANKKATLFVPRCCRTKSPTSKAHAIMTTVPKASNTLVKENINNNDGMYKHKIIPNITYCGSDLFSPQGHQ